MQAGAVFWKKFSIPQHRCQGGLFEMVARMWWHKQAPKVWSSYRIRTLRFYPRRKPRFDFPLPARAHSRAFVFSIFVGIMIHKDMKLVWFFSVYCRVYNYIYCFFWVSIFLSWRTQRWKVGLLWSSVFYRKRPGLPGPNHRLVQLSGNSMASAGSFACICIFYFHRYYNS